MTILRYRFCMAAGQSVQPSIAFQIDFTVSYCLRFLTRTRIIKAIGIDINHPQRRRITCDLADTTTITWNWLQDINRVWH